MKLTKENEKIMRKQNDISVRSLFLLKRFVRLKRTLLEWH